MLSQGQIKQITSLRVKKFREESGLFIAEGEKMVQELLNSRYRVAEVYAPAAWIVANLTQLTQLGVKATETLPREMERISGLTTPSPILAVVEIPISTSAHHHISTLPHQHISTLPHHHITTSSHHHISTLTLALDDIRDPGNLGTIVRVADWFGIGEVVCSEHTVDLYNPKVVQATMGSITRVRVEYRNLQAWLEPLRGQCPVYGAFLQGENLYSEPLGMEGIIVIGNESRGISKTLETFITRKIFIPAFGPGAGGRAESLNASVATAVICAEFRRRAMMQ
jgi:RNA methyltransferase, TrmH family